VAQKRCSSCDVGTPYTFSNRCGGVVVGKSADDVVGGGYGLGSIVVHLRFEQV
jgi:hypothetical protein